MASKSFVVMLNNTCWKKKWKQNKTKQGMKKEKAHTKDE